MYINFFSKLFSFVTISFDNLNICFYFRLPIAFFGCIFYIVGIPACFFAVLSSARNEDVDALTIMLSSDEHERARYLAMARADVETEGGIFTPPNSVSGALRLIRDYTRRKNLRR